MSFLVPGGQPLSAGATGSTRAGGSERRGRGTSQTDSSSFPSFLVGHLVPKQQELIIQLLLHTQVFTQAASTWSTTACSSKATASSRGLENLWTGGRPHSYCPQPSSLLLCLQPPPVPSSPERLFFPFPGITSSRLAWEEDNVCFQPSVVGPGARPELWILGQPSLLKGGGLTWMEMCRHLPSSTHSGDKHSSIPESLHLRPGTDRAVHLGNKARGGGGGDVGGCQAPGQPDGEGTVWLEGCTPEALGEEQRVDLSTAAYLLLPSRHFPFGCKITS